MWVVETETDNITWQWQDNPIGYPMDPDDYDMEGPRTPATVWLCLEYKDGDTLLRQGIERYGSYRALTWDEKEAMKAKLRAWLQEKVK